MYQLALIREQELRGLTKEQVYQSLEGQNIPFKVVRPVQTERRYLSDLEVEVLTLYSQGLHKLLLANSQKWTDYITLKRGLLQDTIDHFQLGAGGRVRNFNSHFINSIQDSHLKKDVKDILTGLHLYNRKQGDYFWSPCVVIPYVYSGQGYYLNARMLPGYDKTMKYQNLSGVSRSYFFNEDVLDSHNEVILVEGEINCMSLWNVGIENVMSFGSKSSFNEDLISKLYGYNVILYYDRDSEDDLC